MTLPGSSMVANCHRTNIGIDAAISTMSKAIQEAVNNCRTTKGRQFQAIKFSAAWVGMAGYGRPTLSSTIDNSLSELLGLSLGSLGSELKITTDIDLLPSSVSGQKDLEHVIVLVAGTGSIAMSYVKKDDQFERTSRVGGWGYLLGDDGSGYDIGREALRIALLTFDLYRIRARKDPAAVPPLSPLSQAVLQHFQGLYPESKPEDLLSAILVPHLVLHEAEGGVLATTKRIAGIAKLVLSMAGSDDEAKRIVDAGVTCLVDLVAVLVHGQDIDPRKSGLVLAGGLTQDELFQDTLMTALEAKCGKFKHTERVAEPAVAGARYLINQVWP
jgi:N-acetylmuramic acid 6-phosphate etherase